MQRANPFLRFGAALLAAALLAGCGGGAIDYLPDVDPNAGVVRAHQMPVQGIDISKYQGDIDWRRVKASGIRFAYIKVSEGGDHVDEKFYQNWEAAARAGMPRGAYHFMYWCRTAAEQALWYQLAVPQDKSQLPPVLDLEWNHQSATCGHKISKEEALAKIDVMLAAMEAHTGKKPIIYTDITFHKDVLEGRYRNYPFWLRSVAAEPKERFKDRPFLIWQFTATGRVEGISGNVDRNAFNGSERDFERWLARSTGG
ncbi:GH25 family lysozyme [Afifella sp. IM 167]|uniref:glycoside hydrolase family 25 protein n=1 Tax=Afifella sp. IM 167 TaxID=2033586 RepID=UPI001CCEEFA4|nr:GH25 family lysozyme [Afifella sp. IM 167]